MAGKLPIGAICNPSISSIESSINPTENDYLFFVEDTAYDFEEKQSIVMVIGVNGVGKTTTVGKLAGKLKGQGRKVLIAAADTFRAAAGEQLEEWCHRAGVDMIGGKEGGDPASVVYDAVNAAKARKADVLLCDTAGRKRAQIKCTKSS